MSRPAGKDPVQDAREAKLKAFLGLWRMSEVYYDQRKSQDQNTRIFREHIMLRNIFEGN